MTSKNNRRQQKGVKREGKARKDSYFNQWWPMLQELQPADVDRSATCPDCGATFDGDCQTMPHEPSCPIYVAYEVASDEDRQWFANTRAKWSGDDRPCWPRSRPS